MTTQKFLTDLHEASVAKYAGYAVRWLPNERQFVVSDPGDLDDLLADVRAGAQTISNALAFLNVYDELRKIKGGTTEPAVTITKPHGESRELVKANIPTVSGRDWTTAGLTTAIFLCYRGNELLHTYVDDGRTKFTFAYDDGLTEAVSLLNQRKIRVEPTEWQVAGSQIRKAMHEAKGY